MSQENETPTAPDPLQTLVQAAGIAEHLQRIGVQWLPVAQPDNLQKLAEQFHFDRPAPALRSEMDAPATAPNSSPHPLITPTDAVKQSSATADAAPVTSEPTTRTTVGRRAATAELPTEFSLSAKSSGFSDVYPGSSLAPQQRADHLAVLADQVAACTRCEILSKCRTKTVFGEGNLKPRVVFFGEGPGRDEDLSGRPFVGKAGQLLTKMINACRFQREDVYILNTVKCRPPNNRNPEPTEVENCREYFTAQLNLLRPEYIVCLGTVSAQALLNTKLSIGMLRGKFYRYFDSKVVITYHPAYLLRTPAAKKAAWDDLQMMLRDAGLL